MATRTQKYDESSIKRLKGLEGVRMRPTQYLGQRGNYMVFQCAKEIWDNAFDEAFAGRNKHIYVHADNKNGSYLIADQAEGIPVGLVLSDPENPRSKKVSMMTLIFTEIHTGGKFDDKAYAQAKGTHGVGASATNAVSSSFEVWTFRDRKWHYQKFAKGLAVGVVENTPPPKSVKDRLNYVPKKGTIVLFSPDQTVVSVDKGKTKAVLELSYTARWLKDMALLNPGIEVTFSANGKTKTFFNKDGLTYLLKYRMQKLECEPEGRVFAHDSGNMSVALQWSSHPEDDQMFTYVCSGLTNEGGEHEVGFRNALFKSISAFKLKSHKFAPKDIYYGLIGIFNYKMSGAEYGGQTKNKLVSNVAADVEKELLPVFNAFFNKNKTLARRIIRRAVDVKKSKEEFRKSLKSVSDAKRATKSNLPSCLVTAPKATVATRELFIVEGDSAGGSAKKARDARYQEVMKLDGKISNAIRTKPHALLASKKIQNLLSAIGYNFDAQKEGDNDPYKKLRVKDIILLPDADVDGDHICVLVLTLLYKLLPKLFDQGRVLIVDAPLYSAYFKGKRYFGDNHQSVVKQLPKAAPKNIVMRAKGWGEIGHETLAHVAFSPTTRKLIKVAPLKTRHCADFERLMGSDTSVRKELLGL